ncbi:MAG: hypothetical protein E6H78_06390, partial [Betaproteobacteria bacterium]
MLRNAIAPLIIETAALLASPNSVPAPEQYEMDPGGGAAAAVESLDDKGRAREVVKVDRNQVTSEGRGEGVDQHALVVEFFGHTSGHELAAALRTLDDQLDGLVLSEVT